MGSGGQVGVGGIIPARAGFTHRDGDLVAVQGDHPRSRGVYGAPSPTLCADRGSSPLARGLPAFFLGGIWEKGIIPARAGFTVLPGYTPGRDVDHPRSRGVYTSVRSGSTSWAGSSPLARGLHAHLHDPRPSPRIIPARAGFTRPSASDVTLISDHPRSRGVYSTTPATPPSPAGSSPLARGLRMGRTRQAMVMGIIPARAGFTGRRLEPPAAANGSSPLARGLRREVRRREADQRIIPARAGFTAFRRWPAPRWRDHPRSRGVYGRTEAGLRSPRGSSPLARGLLQPVLSAVWTGRIIPARAGFTRRPVGR